MGLWEAITQGQGTPWGAGNQKGNLGLDWMTTGQGTPWGAGGQKGLSAFNSFADPISANTIGNPSWAGSPSAMQGRAEHAAMTGDDTPWGGTGKKGMGAFMDPTTSNALSQWGTPEMKSGINDLNSGAFDLLGMGGPEEKAPTRPTLESDPNKYAAPDFADYNRAGQEKINMGLARSRNNMAAGMQKRGALSGGDMGLGMADLDMAGADARGGLANAISKMQMDNKWGQMNAANQGTIDKYNNDYSNYQGNVNKRNANKGTAQNAFTTAASIGAAFI